MVVLSPPGGANARPSQPLAAALLVLFLLLAIPGWAAPDRAAPGRAAPGRTETVVVPMDPYPPWKVVDTQSRTVSPEGIDNRLLEAVLAAFNTAYGANLEPDYQAFPWKRCLELLRQGRADLISGILRTPEREQYLVFIDPPYKTHSAKVFYLRKGEGRHIRRHEDLHGLRIGVQAGVRYFERFDTDPAIYKEDVSEDLYNFRKLEHGRIDAFISTETQADYLIAVHGFADRFEKAHYRHDYELPVYFALSRRSPWAEAAPRFSWIVEKLATEGVFKGIIEGYFKRLEAAWGERKTP